MWGWTGGRPAWAAAGATRELADCPVNSWPDPSRNSQGSAFLRVARSRRMGRERSYGANDKQVQDLMHCPWHGPHATGVPFARKVLSPDSRMRSALAVPKDREKRTASQNTDGVEADQAMW